MDKLGARMFKKISLTIANVIFVILILLLVRLILSLFEYSKFEFYIDCAVVIMCGWFIGLVWTKSENAGTLKKIVITLIDLFALIFIWFVMGVFFAFFSDAQRIEFCIDMAMVVLCGWHIKSVWKRNVRAIALDN
ncbi:hypothetical protein [Glaciimonas soli]|uniref:Uncharacterized protein n=1 Tax=Glaciimonas soli TaxID=2590999 RepID=A0A843YN93_9BURK|nr:hypothetical protein [Glaciimonas soli]MQQ99243.1 hypothetical protein [Glaciimonas soli]